MLYAFFFKRRGSGYWIPILIGFGAGVFTVGYSIQWAYPAFLKYAFLILPRYDPLLNGYIYPFESIEFLIPVFMISLLIYWLTYRFVVFENPGVPSNSEKLKAFFQSHFLEIFLVALSVVFYRRVLGRSDLGHLADSISPLLFTMTFIAVKHFLRPGMKRINGEKPFVPGVALLAAVFFSISYLPHVNWSHLYKLPNDIGDEVIVPDDYAQAVRFLKSRMEPHDDFLTMTSEPIWYYLLDKPSPIRFQSIYQAMPPFYQEEVVRDLRRSDVKYVLYRNGHWANAMDGYSNEVRIPRIVSYIREQFAPLRTIAGHEIWIRKNETEHSQNGAEKA
jgi:hypothetical protein